MLDADRIRGDGVAKRLDEGGLETSGISYPMMVREDAGFSRQALQRFLESRGIATRMVWSGNILRQPAFEDSPHRAATRTPTA